MAYKVLIVEDDPMVSMINEQYVLKTTGFEIAATCRNGKEAVEYLQNNNADLILLDVFMPVMDGVETLKKIRELKIETEVIMITAANDSSTIEATMNLGVLDYLIKPFAFERFNISLEKYKSKREALKGSDTLDQNAIDSFISGGSNIKSEKTNYPKGIQKNTLDRILKYFEQREGWYTVDMISSELGVSIVTVRNYLTYLVEEKLVVEDINYNTGGRPSMLFKSAK